MNHSPTEPKNIVVGLSGGVDSAVTALLLKKQGHHVSGVFMQNWQSDNDDPYCTAEQDLSDAKAIANQIGIPLYTVDFSQDYWDQVFKHCLDEFAAGRTPNPDIWCNREIKFKVFLDHALKMNADYLATGHYARILRTASASDQQFQLLRGLDASKDQSYFLYTLNQNQLSKSLFPLGDMHKKDVRKMAEENNLINYNKKDSTGICFIGERKFKAFLKGFLIAQPGEIKTDKGKIIGEHDGVMFYTLGQRKGLNIGGKKDFAESPWYVVEKDVKTNTLIVGQGHNHPLLFKSELWCDDLSWVAGDCRLANVPRNDISSKIRYRQQDEACSITDIKNNSAHIVFEQPQRAVTPGQSIVFYDNEICLGGGIITEPTEAKA